MKRKSLTSDELIQRFNLQPHPEGGYYARSYAAAGTINKGSLPPGTQGIRSYTTAIYFLLAHQQKSRFHRLKSDELWHYYLGDPLVVVELEADGTVRKTKLGQDLRRGQVLQHVVRAGTWFGSYLCPGSKYALVGCTVSPGFDFSDFELADRERLSLEFPKAKAIIRRLS